MSQITFRPALAEDIAKFADRSAAPTLLGWIAEFESRPVALGGFARVNGRWAGFLDVTEEGRALLEKNVFVRAALVRGAVTALREAQRKGIRFIYADADQDQKKADDLLIRLGFEPDERSARYYRWSNKEYLDSR